MTRRDLEKRNVKLLKFLIGPPKHTLFETAILFDLSLNQVARIKRLNKDKQEAKNGA